LRKIPVLIAAEVSTTLLELLRSDDRFAIDYRPAADEETLVAALHEHEVLVTRHYNKVTRRVIERGVCLRLIAQGTSGVDNIDAAAAAERRVRIVNTPGENANAVAELVIGEMIMLTRTVPSYHRSVVAGEWDRADCNSRHELRHFRLGIVGLGRVGTRVAHFANLFRMNVTAYDPYIADDDFNERGATRVSSLEELLAASDILSLHVPLTTETAGMIGRGELERLPDGAFVINASRGEVLDLGAVRSQIESGRLSGAAIDVFAHEPPTEMLPDDPRIVFTPHIAGCSYESKESIGRELYREICAFLNMTPIS
jgi:D-3-phosphoglycerate dehydrogenase / 2-oxoglutarate reductase